MLQSKKYFNPATAKPDELKVATVTSTIRDLYIVSEIQKFKSEGYSIFALYGAKHVIMQEPVLKKMYNVSLE